jgi:hypothetical protein
MFIEGRTGSTAGAPGEDRYRAALADLGWTGPAPRIGHSTPVSAARCPVLDQRVAERLAEPIGVTPLPDCIWLESTSTTTDRFIVEPIERPHPQLAANWDRRADPRCCIGPNLSQLPFRLRAVRDCR